VGILPTSLTPLDEPLSVIVISSLSHPLNTLIEARLLGALERPGYGFRVTCCPVSDEQLSRLDLAAGLPIYMRHPRSSTSCPPGNWKWRASAEIEPVLHECALRYRQAKQKERRIPNPPGRLLTSARSWLVCRLERTPRRIHFHELPVIFSITLVKPLPPMSASFMLCAALPFQRQKKRAVPTRTTAGWCDDSHQSTSHSPY